MAEYLSGGGLPKLESWTEFAPPGSNARQLARYYAANWNSNHTWAELERIRRLWPGPLVIKGLVHPDDVRQAVRCGVDAVTVSNHGGTSSTACRAASTLWR